MNLSDNCNILDPEEYDTLYQSIAMAGIDLESEDALKIVKLFEKAAVDMSLLSLMARGLAKFEGLDPTTGDMLFGLPNELVPKKPVDDGDEEEGPAEEFWQRN